MEKATNIELFNGITGKVFAQLYEKFPIEAEIQLSGFLDDFIDPTDFSKIWDLPEMTKATIKWLDRAGYIWLKDPDHYGGGYKATLTPKGLEVLKATPDSIEPTHSIGEKMVEFSKKQFGEGMNQVVKIAISEGIKFVYQSAS
jgi:hypothetical protein